MRRPRRPQTPRSGVRGEVADPCRRPRRRTLRRRSERQGRRAPRALHRRGPRRGRRDDRPRAGHEADRSRRPAGAPGLCRGRLRHRPRTVFLAAGRPRHRADHAGRLDRRRHGDRGSRRQPSREDPARRDRSRHRSVRLSRPAAGLRSGPGRQAGARVRQDRHRLCTRRSSASTARSSRSIRWSSPRRATWSRWMPRSASTTTRCSAIRNWRSCATRRKKIRRNSKPRSTT